MAHPVTSTFAARSSESRGLPQTHLTSTFLSLQQHAPNFPEVKRERLALQSMLPLEIHPNLQKSCHGSMAECCFSTAS